MQHNLLLTDACTYLAVEGKGLIGVGSSCRSRIEPDAYSRLLSRIAYCVFINHNLFIWDTIDVVCRSYVTKAIRQQQQHYLRVSPDCAPRPARRAGIHLFICNIMTYAGVFVAAATAPQLLFFVVPSASSLTCARAPCSRRMRITVTVSRIQTTDLLYAEVSPVVFHSRIDGNIE